MLSEIATASPDDLKDLFGNITTIYEDWIKEESKKIKNISVSKDKKTNDDFIAVAQKQQKFCLLALKRIKKGISALSDPYNPSGISACTQSYADRLRIVGLEKKPI